MKLFESYKLGSTVLKNRMVMAPMTRCRATVDHVPTPEMAEYYAQRAGAGLIITEGVSPSPDGAGYARIPGIWSEKQIRAWEPVTSAVHKKGGVIFMQIMHTGRISHPDNLTENGRVVAPSAIAASTTKVWSDQAMGVVSLPEPHALRAEELEKVKNEFVQAAENAIKAGFDGVELHGANGYLLEQFLSPSANQRSDSYGGNAENRNRFVLEVVEAVAERIGKEKTGIRISPYGAYNDIVPFDGIDEQYSKLIEGLSRIGIVYLHLVNHSSMGAPEIPAQIFEMCRGFSGTFILSGGFDRDRAENALQQQEGDLVAFGKTYLANPDLAERFRLNVSLNEPDYSTFYTPGVKGYTDYPFYVS